MEQALSNFLRALNEFTKINADLAETKRNLSAQDSIESDMLKALDKCARRKGKSTTDGRA